MKRFKLFISVALVFIAISGFSQLNFAVEGGISSSSFTATNVDRFLSQPKVRPHLGGFAHLKIYKGFGLRAGLKYQMKGAGFTYVDTNQLFFGAVELEHKTGYLSVPLIFQYNIGKRVKNGFHLNFGINNSFLLHDKFTGRYVYEDQNGDSVEKDFPTILTPRNQEMSFIVGVGLASAGILFEFNYEQSFKNLYPVSEEAPKVRNSVFNISVGYIF